jgi:hypothetical protein
VCGVSGGQDMGRHGVSPVRRGRGAFIGSWVGRSFLGGQALEFAPQGAGVLLALGAA